MSALAPNSDPFPTAAHTARLEYLAARIALANPLDGTGASAHDLRHDIAHGNLVIHARHRDPDGTLHALGVFRATDQYVLLTGEGAERTVRAQFPGAAKARQFFRAEILREPPTAKTPLVDVQEFASTLCSRLPGWTSHVEDITLDGHHAELAARVWDLGTLYAAFERYVLHEAAVLTGPGGAQIVAVRRPGYRDQLLIGALRPASLPDHLLDADDCPVPWAVAVDRDPVRAAAEVQQRLLPRYEHAVWRLRVRALNLAAEGIKKAQAAWDAVSDSYGGADGHRVEVRGHAEGKAARDAAAWEYVETFLAHGLEVHAGIRAHVTVDDYLTGPIRDDLQRLRGIDDVLARVAMLRSGWEEAAAIIATAPPGSREVYLDRARELRDSDGWHYADELTYSGAALARVAEHLTDRIGADRAASEHRVQAALARSAATPSAAPPASPGPPAVRTTPAVRRAH